VCGRERAIFTDFPVIGKAHRIIFRMPGCVASAGGASNTTAVRGAGVGVPGDQHTLTPGMRVVAMATRVAYLLSGSPGRIAHCCWKKTGNKKLR